MKVLPASKVTFICPNIVIVPVMRSESYRRDQLFENLWIVDKESFNGCRVNTSRSDNKPLIKCEDPLKLKYNTVVFQRFTAAVGGLEYHPGTSYYFIGEFNRRETH